MGMLAGVTSSRFPHDGPSSRLTSEAKKIASNFTILNVPPSAYSTAALQSAAIPAANLVGGAVVSFENTGTTPATLTTDTAAAIIAALPVGVGPGYGWDVYIRNSSGSANTATIAGGTGVTAHGTLTIAQNATRRFVFVINAAGTGIDIYSMGLGAAAV